MELDEICFSGYRAFAGGDFDSTDLQVLKLAPLTVIFGKNNSGKSTAVRLPRFLLGGLVCEDERILPLEVRGLKFGSRFLDVIHGNDYFTRPTFGIKARSGTSTLDLKAELFLTPAAPDEPPRFWSYGIKSASEVSQIEPGQWRGNLLPATEEFSRWRQGAAALLSGMVHLGPMRSRIPTSFSVENPNWLDHEGKYAPQWLQSDLELADRAERWFFDCMEGWRLSVERSLDNFSIRVSQSSRMTSNLAYAGSGLQQVLPVVTHQIWRQLREHRGSFLDLVEQPELHLHDAVHASLADLFVDTARDSNGTTIVETHSKSFLLRLQRRVAEGAISLGKIKLYFVESGPDGSQLKSVGLNSDGEVEAWPEGVFEEDFREVAAIRRAQLRRASQRVVQKEAT